MKSKPVFIILLILVTTILVVFANLELMASSTSILKPELLSNHEETYGGDTTILLHDSRATQNAVHLVWAEATTSGPDYNLDIFYRRLPNGQTINLSARITTTTKGSVGPVVIQPSIGDDVCVLWRENIETDDHYLYLWRSMSDTVSRSPNPVVAYSPNTSQFNCNSTHDAKITWADSAAKEVYLWDEAENSETRLSNGSASVSYGSLYRVDINNNFYLTWDESGNKYIWDSISETAQSLGPGHGPTEVFVDKDQTIHLIWSYQNLGPPCHYYWNSLTQTTDNLVPCGDWDIEVEEDGLGNIHAAWLPGSGTVTAITYRNFTENITESIGISTTSFVNMNLIGGSDHKAHLFWQQDYYLGQSELYYWNSVDLSATHLISASDLIQERMAWDFDSNGEIHTLWVDDDFSDSNNRYFGYWTPALTSTLILTESVPGAARALVVDNQDVVHTIFSGSDLKLYHWDNQTNQTEAASNSPQSNSPKMLVDKNNEVFAFYSALPVSHYYWSSISGESYLGKMALWKESIPLSDEMNNVYVYWIEEDYAEGQDMHAAWQIELNHVTYLPVVTK